MSESRAVENGLANVADTATTADTADTADNRKKRVCVVGAGSAGLCAARHLAVNLNFEIVVYEQTAQIGGTWVYTEKTGLDENGQPIHSSMYRDLRTNLPVRVMNFLDFEEMTAAEPSCLTREEVLDYLKNYAQHFDLHKYIQFNTKVMNIDVRASADNRAEEWTVRVKNFKTNETKESIFDAVMICNGHYFDPAIPEVSGIETFPGTVMHSHDYRMPEVFEGKTIFVFGAGLSGIDISVEVANYVPRVYLSHDNARLTGILPNNVDQVMGVDHVVGRKIFLTDGTFVEADVFLFCTGYRYSFPFLSENCGIRVDENYIFPLYKHLINVAHPTMCIVGIASQVTAFPICYMQVQFFTALLRNKVQLPAKEVMMEDAKLKTTKKRHAHKLRELQWDYNDWLADTGHFQRLPKYYKSGYVAFGVQRKRNLMRYKYSKFLICDDGETVEVTLPEDASV